MLRRHNNQIRVSTVSNRKYIGEDKWPGQSMWGGTMPSFWPLTSNKRKYGVALGGRHSMIVNTITNQKYVGTTGDKQCMRRNWKGVQG